MKTIKRLTAAAGSLALAALLAACASSPSTAQPSYVGIDAAKEAALSDLQLSADAATFTSADLEDRNGTAYYELDFTDGTNQYHYAVDAITGAIIESSSGGSATGSGPVDEAGAQAIALADAGVAEADTVYLRVQPDYDDGRAVYDVEFYADGSEYDYEIDADTGAILSKDFDAEGYTSDAAAAASIAGGDAAVTEAEAQATALADAGVAEADTIYLKVRQDYDDGRLVYDVEFYANGSEYDYEIDANTGAILSKDFDAEGYTPSGSTGSSVDEAGAQAIALADAGVTEADTVYLRVQPDYDDGRLVYDVEFYADGSEYDYEIDADTGAILSKDFDAEGYTPAQSGSAKSEDEIRSIALAKVPGATSDNIRLHKDFDDGRQIYEGEILYDGVEYEFEIDAYSGAVLSWEAESMFD